MIMQGQSGSSLALSRSATASVAAHCEKPRRNALTASSLLIECWYSNTPSGASSGCQAWMVVDVRMLPSSDSCALTSCGSSQKPSPVRSQASSRVAGMSRSCRAASSSSVRSICSSQLSSPFSKLIAKVEMSPGLPGLTRGVGWRKRPCRGGFWMG